MKPHRTALISSSSALSYIPDKKAANTEHRNNALRGVSIVYLQVLILGATNYTAW